LQTFYIRLTRPLFEAFARFVFRFYCPLSVIGRENLPPLPFLLCSNHASHMDSIVLMAASRYGFRRFGLLAAKDYFFRNALLYGCFSCMVNLIPISRRPTPQSMQDTLDECRKFLSGDARGLILFPEGTRSATGSIGDFKPGAGMLALKLGLPLVPAYVEGTREAMPKGRLFPIPRSVTIRIGQPILPDAMATNGNGRLYDDIVLEAKRRVHALKGSADAQ
jgi:1-acyl-sn-glycerol-3-phosphate acyltransferase